MLVGVIWRVVSFGEIDSNRVIFFTGQHLFGLLPCRRV
jgi:hypothetical protein